MLVTPPAVLFYLDPVNILCHTADICAESTFQTMVD
jgi:hypothetical protein